MRTKVTILAVLLLLLTACAGPWGDLPQTGKQGQVSGEPNLVGAYPEMNSADFWVDRVESPDKVILSASQIEAFNQKVPQTAGTDCVDLNSYPKALSREELLEMLARYTIPEETRYIGNRPLDEAYYKELFLNRNEVGVAEQNAVRLGVIVQNTQLRNWPTADVSYNVIDDVEFDLGCETVLKTCERVAILHESADKEWLYLQAYNYIGWVRAQDVASCTEEQWNTLGENTDWLTVTGNRVVLDFSNVTPAVSRRELTMGTKLMLVKDKPAAIDGISTVSSHVVLLPVRDATGGLQLVATRVPQGLDVTQGFLAYTPRNLLEQSFKMLGERYGWSSLWDARDCASFVMDIYHCFGIELPRNASKQAAVAGKRTDVSGYTDEDKQALIMRQPAGTMLELQGHIMLYLGTYEGKPYVIHQVYAFVPREETKVAQVGCVLVSDLEIKRSSGDSFLKSIRTVNAVQYLS